MRMSPADAGPLVHESGLVLVGERHGTNEFPNLVLALATAAAQHGPVIVALELGDDARDQTAAFVRSAGTAADRERLLGTPSWQQRDGRASQAMLRLVDGLRAHVCAGADIELDVFDAIPAGEAFTNSYEIERDRLLAAKLLAVRGRGTTLALTGNVYAELMPRADAPEGFVPAAALLAAQASLTSLLGRHSGGESWCIQLVNDRVVTGVHHVEGQDRGADEFLELEQRALVRSGVAYVGTISASPPAADRDESSSECCVDSPTRRHHGGGRT